MQRQASRNLAADKPVMGLRLRTTAVYHVQNRIGADMTLRTCATSRGRQVDFASVARARQNRSHDKICIMMMA